ncbi:hypothetical protein CEXT_743991 [Caerostris extrusa]|uniref:Uncharacterized protein n=1 Tax=Caerostris extrusa TaxID=172846 RepID=A0AAV4QUE7_CAEEX|nr:hypothetical protein CEXT_743991 [Caerostris extrusa]
MNVSKLPPLMHPRGVMVPNLPFKIQIYDQVMRVSSDRSNGNDKCPQNSPATHHFVNDGARILHLRFKFMIRYRVSSDRMSYRLKFFPKSRQNSFGISF